MGSLPKDYGPAAALGVAIVVAIMYEQGGIPQLIASLILLAVLLTPVSGHSLAERLLIYLDALITGGQSLAKG